MDEQIAGCCNLGQKFQVNEVDYFSVEHTAVLDLKMPKKQREGDLIITSVTEEQSEQGQNYYSEHRGPIILVRGPHTEIKLSFIPTEEENDANFVCEYLEPFGATSRGLDKQFITLRNEGTTGIRFQWLRFPPNYETEFLLANPAGSVVPGGGSWSFPKASSRKRLNDEKICKPVSHQFRFRELPCVLLPGQSIEFTIVFRSQEPGYFYENLYLLTHPKLRDAEGRGYSLRLSGICMDPDFVESDGNKSPRPGNINDIVNQTTMDEEAKDLLDAILDHALFIEPEHPSTLPYLKVTSESIFYTHNRNLKYYYEISQQSLDTVRRLIELLVPQQRIERDQTVCTLSIESLYQLLWTRNSANDLYWVHFKTNTTEKLLKKFAKYNNILIKPRKFAYAPAASRKISSSYATFISVMDEILTAMEQIDSLYSSPDLEEIYLKISTQKCETGNVYEKDENNEWDFGAFIPPANKEIPESDLVDDKINPTNNAGDEDEEEEAEEALEQLDESPESIPETKSKLKKGKQKKDKSDKTKVNEVDTVQQKSVKKEKKKPKPTEEVLDGSVEEQEQPEGMEDEDEDGDEGQEELALENVETPPTEADDVKPTQPGEDEVNENDPNDRATDTPLPERLTALPSTIQEQFMQEKKRRIYQAKRMVFEDLLAEGIERILCAVDSFNAMEDYRASELSAPHSVATNYCCFTD